MVNLDAAEQAMIREQEDLFERLRLSLQQHVVRRDQGLNVSKIAKTIDDLRAALNEVREEDMSMVVSQIQLMTSLAEQKLQSKLPNLNLPYFGFLRLREDDGRTREILIGEIAYLDPDHKVAIVSWHDSPFAEVFFNCREGEDYDIDLPNKSVATGTVELRLVLSFHNGKLLRIDRGAKSWARDGEGWVKPTSSSRAHLRGGEGATVVENNFGTGATNLQNPIVKALLDPQQYALIQQSPREPLLVIGSAGSGKTTVALHRLAAIHQKDPQHFPQKALLVVVPEKGLEALTRRLLNDLGLPQVSVRKFDDWVIEEGRRLLRDVPRRICDETPAAVQRFKGHHGFKVALLQYVADLEAALIERMEKKHHFIPAHAVEEFRSRKAVPLWQRLKEVRSRALEHLRSMTDSREQLSFLEEFFRQEEKAFFNWNLHRIELFGNEALIERAVESSNGEITKEMVRQLLNHTRQQFAEDDKQRYEGWDESVLSTVDGRSIDDGTPDSVANTIDVEDFPVLLSLLLHLTGSAKTGVGGIRQFKHVILDEAQEYSPVELNVIGRAIAAHGNITVAGDAAQQTDPTSHFRNWDKVLDDLDVKRVSAQKLNISYRSTREIMRFAHKVLGPFAPDELARCDKDGPEVKVTTTSSFAESLVLIGDVLRDLLEAEREASIAVVCQNLDNAKDAYKRLVDVGRTRLVTDGNFTFRPGVDFTDVVQVKGLEFDYVIIPDATQKDYPDDPIARRKMHVAVTRGIHQVWVLTSGKPSPII